MQYFILLISFLAMQISIAQAELGFWQSVASYSVGTITLSTLFSFSIHDKWGKEMLYAISLIMVMAISSNNYTADFSNAYTVFATGIMVSLGIIIGRQTIFVEDFILKYIVIMGIPTAIIVSRIVLRRSFGKALMETVISSAIIGFLIATCYLQSSKTLKIFWKREVVASNLHIFIFWTTLFASIIKALAEKSWSFVPISTVLYIASILILELVISLLPFRYPKST